MEKCVKDIKPWLNRLPVTLPWLRVSVPELAAQENGEPLSQIY